ncbi:hypothetical protein LWC34_37960 [Kibdelosporangium philippinense]|uniref:Uncharacterized protein n=1 Tax=Kibdelosporangium philippinense TaxID=211113 RepID=A0ABS8ZL81_9PSEU|nr:hypothetical protein [Kibdelosporangium philippinense]MCE7008558.1 hypothetical protein [Kibdelosporangium philippinense]
MLGVVADDVVTGCGEALVATTDGTPDEASSGDVAGQLAGRTAEVLVETPDLTAVVSGQPTVAASRVLGASVKPVARLACGGSTQRGCARRGCPQSSRTRRAS